MENTLSEKINFRVDWRTLSMVDQWAAEKGMNRTDFIRSVMATYRTRKEDAEKMRQQLELMKKELSKTQMRLKSMTERAQAAERTLADFQRPFRAHFDRLVGRPFDFGGPVHPKTELELLELISKNFKIED